MKRHVLAVCAILALVSGVAHAYSWAHISNISSTLGMQSNRLCVGVPSSLHVDDLGCPTYSPYLTSGGLLGVGTSSPTATLQVSGSFVVSSTGQTSSPSLYVGTDGNVGIGTSSPISLLSVGSANKFTVNTLGLVTANGMSVSSGQNINFTGYGAVNPLSGGVGLKDASDNQVLVAISGKVGIGTTNPSTTLHVSGTVLTTSWTGINFSSTGNVTPTAPLEVSGTVSATHFVGDGSGLTGVTAASSDRITSGTTQMVVVSTTGYVSLTQASTNTGWFDPTRGLVTLGVSSTGGLSGTTGYFSGNVGIGTTAPASKLDITTGMTVNGLSLRSGGANLYTAYTLGRTTQDSFWGVAGQTDNFALGAAVGDTVLGTNNTGSLHLSARNAGYTPNITLTTAGKVGIGTTNPTTTLHVSGSFLVSTSAQTTTPSLYVGTNGNVGIGTTSPNDKLSIYGGALNATFDVGLDGNGYPSLWPSNGVMVFRSAQFTNPVTFNSAGITLGGASLALSFNGSGTYGSGDTGLSRGAAGKLYVGNGTAGDSTGTLIAGKVGIGTTAPSQTLHVSGSVLTTSWTGINFSSTGNVTPTAPLEVSGTISATHFVGDGSGLTNLSVQGDRITSGTASVIATQDTGAEVSGTLKLTNTGSETCDPAHYNALRVDPTTHSIQICLP